MFNIFKRPTEILVLANATATIRAERDNHLKQIEYLDRVIDEATERRRQHNVAFEALNETLFTITSADMTDIALDLSPMPEELPPPMEPAVATDDFHEAYPPHDYIPEDARKAC